MKTYIVYAEHGNDTHKHVTQKLGVFKAPSMKAAIAQAEQSERWFGFWQTYGASSALFAIKL